MTATKTCPDDHKHGESGTCYVHHKCRCDVCVAGNARRESNRRRQKAYGRYVLPWVDAEPVRAHVEYLRARGMGYKTIAKRAGIGPTGVRTLIYGREDYLPGGGTGPRHGEMLKQVGREKAEKIMAVRPDLRSLPSTAPVPARGTVRRIQALMAFGWSQSRLAEHLGVLDSNLSKIRLQYEQAAARGRGSRVHVQAATAIAVAALYDRLSVVQPPRSEWRDKIAYSRTRRMAAEKGWALPMDWEAYENDFDRVQAPRRSAAA